ncbi:glycosyltransferase [Niabella sp.]|uniref:glycosyltransferase n=1 Tax=Niabella sp. TaxID=1962976 RepID=UPI0026367495|nr:glycosyltransferase [Niabella sp.]
MELKRHVLWLCSWYPNRVAPFDGDFVQRHARAVSLYNQVHVIKITPDPEAKKVEDVSTTGDAYPNLTEQCIYYPKKQGLGGKIQSYFWWNSLFKKAIRAYIAQHGKPDLVHVHIPFKAGLMAQWIKRKYGIPFVVTEHWDGYNRVVENHYLQRPSWFRRIITTTFHRAAGIHSVSDYLGKEINQLGRPVSYVVINNAVDTRFFYREERQHAGPFQLLHISGGAAKKNVEGIIRAFLNLPQQEFSLCILGLPPAMNERYQKQYPGIRFPGIQSNETVAAALRATDLLVIFSNAENSPCVIGEAFCCGVPVVATSVGGIGELVRDENGVLVLAGDEAGLTDAIRRIRAHYHRYDPEKIARKAIDWFGYEPIGKKLDDWYRDVIRNTR